VFAVLFPVNNWDALGYIGCATASATSDPKAIHDSAYEALKGVQEFEKLTKESVDSIDWYGNAYHFTELLPFYSVKAIFIGAILCIHKLGVSWLHTGHVVSGMAYSATGVLVTFWLSKYVSGYRSTLLWLCVMTVPTVAQTARIFTPDALSCALVVFAAWLILEQRRYWWGASAAILTVWVRPDYLLFAGILTVALWMIRRLRLVEAAVLIGLTLGSYAFLTQVSGNYGWLLLFRHSFMGYLTAPGEFVVDTGAVLHSYPHVLLAAIRYELLNSFLLAYYALGGFLLLVGIRRECKAVLATTLLFGVAHVLIFPTFENRFFGPITVIVSMSMVTMQLKRRSTPHLAQQSHDSPLPLAANLTDQFEGAPKCWPTQGEE
jgi:hypothetical protein